MVFSVENCAVGGMVIIQKRRMMAKFGYRLVREESREV
jgi:hypothetical protein